MNLHNAKAWCLGVGLGLLTAGTAYGADQDDGNPREGQGRPRGPIPAEQFFARFDLDLDGAITLDEFTKGQRPGGGDQGDRRPQPPKEGEGKRPPPDGGGDKGPGDRPKPPSRDELFARLDANGDGQLSREEFNALPPPPNGGERGEGGRPGGERPDGDRGDRGDKGEGGQRPPRDGEQGNRPRPPRDGEQGEGGQRPPQGERPDPAQFFKQLDQNADGKVTVEEYKKFHEQRGRGPGGDRPAGKGGDRPREK